MLLYLNRDGMSEMQFDIIGLSDERDVVLPSDTLEVISSAKVFSGGKRHHEIVEGILPGDAQWIDITVPLSDVIEAYKGFTHIVVFASGDPLFYGFGATLMRLFPEARFRIWPQPNSLQMLARAIPLPYSDMVCVSATGRPYDALDAALIEGKEMIGVLTDRQKTPQAIASRMLRYGFVNYRVYVGSRLGNNEEQRVEALSVKETAMRSFPMPNCLILKKEYPLQRPFGIPDDEFEHLAGRQKMITKCAIRLLALSMLDLRNRSTMWDIGFCTGSVSVEAKLQFPSLKIVAFEIREEGERLMKVNSERFHAPGINALTGDFMEVEKDDLPRPDAIFIGGHGGKLQEMLKVVAQYAMPGATIVFNSVSDKSLNSFKEGCAEVGFSIMESHRMALDDFNPITIIKACKR